MELHTKNRLGVVHDSSKRRSRCLPDHVERCRLVCNLVSVRHPHLERGAKVREQPVGKRVSVCARRGKNLDLSKTVFAMRMGLDFAAEGLSDFLSIGVIWSGYVWSICAHLETIANAEYWYT